MCHLKSLLLQVFKCPVMYCPHELEQLIFFKMTILHKASYIFYAISIKILMAFSTELEQKF